MAHDTAAMTVSPPTASSADSGDQNAGVYRRSIIASPGEVRCSPISVDPNVFHGREVALSGSLAHDHEDFLDAVWSIGQGAIGLQPLLSAVFPLAELDAAFEVAARPDTYRVFVAPNGEVD